MSENIKMYDAVDLPDRLFKYDGFDIKLNVCNVCYLLFPRESIVQVGGIGQR